MYFSPKMVAAAQLALPHLLELARVKSTTQYGELCKKMGMASGYQRNMGRVLDVIHELCVANGFPDLAALVVNAKTGEPGDRYCLLNTWKAEVVKVHAFDWSKVDHLRGSVMIRIG